MKFLLLSDNFESSAVSLNDRARGSHNRQQQENQRTFDEEELLVNTPFDDHSTIERKSDCHSMPDR